MTRMMLGADIFVGPLLRRAEADLVLVCLATFEPFNLKFSIRAFGADRWSGHDSEPIAIRALQNLNFYYGIVVPMKGEKFPTHTLLEYSIGVVDPVTEAVEYDSFRNIVLLDKLSYLDNELPTFFLQKPGQKLNALYGSCRKIHDEKGGKNDALSFGDGVVENYFSDLGSRPAVLCLGGDQIYADDVHKTALDEILILGNKISGGKSEILPAGLTLPPVGARADFVVKSAKFTSGEATNHLVTFSEYMGMYGLMWNGNNWSQHYPELAHFTDSLPKVRRLMANTPTYMIFDDHDVTDDWNLSVKWKEDVKAFKLGKRIVANALGVYLALPRLRQQPGTLSEGSDVSDRGYHLRERQQLRCVRRLPLGTRWLEFFTPTYPFIYFLDTRTQRGLKDGALGHDRERLPT